MTYDEIATIFLTPTDLSQAALVAALGTDIDEMVALSASISEQILAAGWFPSDPRKRAGG